MEVNPNTPGKLPVIILAAGMSERAGFPKPFLHWDNHTTFIEKIVNEYMSFEAGQVIIVLNETGYSFVKKNIPIIAEYVEIVINKDPERGRLSSLKEGLKYLHDYEACYIQNVDNPFVTDILLDSMDRKSAQEAYVVPVFKGKGGHPVLISKEIAEYISALPEDDSDLKRILEKFRRIEFETEDDKILVNINTMEDYRKYFKHLHHEY